MGSRSDFPSQIESADVLEWDPGDEPLWTLPVELPGDISDSNQTPSRAPWVHADPREGDVGSSLRYLTNLNGPWNPPKAPYSGPEEDRSAQSPNLSSGPQLVIECNQMISLMRALLSWNEEAKIKFREIDSQIQQLHQDTFTASNDKMWAIINPPDILGKMSVVLSSYQHECNTLAGLHQKHFGLVEARFWKIYKAAKPLNAPLDLSNSTSNATTRYTSSSVVERLSQVPDAGRVPRIDPAQLHQAASLFNQDMAVEEQQKKIKDTHTSLHSNDEERDISSHKAVMNPTTNATSNVSLEKTVPDGPAQGRKQDLARTTHKYTCSNCGESFKRKSILDQHIICHTSERPFPCLHCDQRFKRLKDRDRHQELQHGEKRFICGNKLLEGTEWGCQKTFSRKDSLIAHFRTPSNWHCLRPLICDYLGAWIQQWVGDMRCYSSTDTGCDAAIDSSMDLQKHFLEDSGRECVTVWVIKEVLLRDYRLIQRQKESSKTQNTEEDPSTKIPEQKCPNEELRSEQPHFRRLTSPTCSLSQHSAESAAIVAADIPPPPNDDEFPTHRSRTRSWSPSLNPIATTAEHISASKPFARPSPNLQTQRNGSTYSPDRIDNLTQPLREDDSAEESNYDTEKSREASVFSISNDSRNRSLPARSPYANWTLVTPSRECHRFSGEKYYLTVRRPPVARRDIVFSFGGKYTHATECKMDKKASQGSLRQYDLTARVPRLEPDIDQEISVSILLSTTLEDGSVEFPVGRLAYVASSPQSNTTSVSDTRPHRASKHRSRLSKKRRMALKAGNSFRTNSIPRG